MKERIVKYLCCPKCKSEDDLKLSIATTDRDTNHIIEGLLECTSCKSIYPIKNGVPFFSTGEIDPTVDLNRNNFADEWIYFTGDIDKTLAKNELDSYFHDFISYSDLNNKVILDAGCGGGRFTYVTASETKAKEIFAVDLSHAVLSAFKNTKHFDNVTTIQADITNLPFKSSGNNKPFDFIYSVGVLHHLPNPFVGFTSLTKHLKEDGKILAWVYGKEGNELYINFADPIRQMITSKLPFKINLALSYIITSIAWAVIWGVYLPLNLAFSRKLMDKALPFNEYFEFFRKRGFRDFWRTIIDKMIPTISYYISHDEFASWFEKNNLDYKLYFRNGHSWTGFGEYLHQSKIQSKQFASMKKN